MIEQKNICGVLGRHKNAFAKVKPGGKQLIYLKQERNKDMIKELRIVAVYEAVSKFSKLPKAWGTYPPL